MAYNDINLKNGAFVLDGSGDFLLQDREVEIAADIVIMPPAGLKYAPTIYGDANSFLNATFSDRSVIQRKFKVALKSAGFSAPLVDVSDFPNTININNNQLIISTT